MCFFLKRFEGLEDWRIGELTRLNESGLTRVKCVGGLRELKHVILILILLVNGMIYC